MLQSLFNPFHLKRWLLPLSSGFALFFVLFVYEGYGIQTGLSFSGHGLLFRAVAFGALTAVIFYLAETYGSRFVPRQTLLQKVGWSALLLFAGGNGTFLLFNYFWNWTEWFWGAYFLILIEYACVLAFPLAMYWLLENRQQKNTAAAVVLESGIEFRSENGKVVLRIAPENLFGLKSADNYVEVWYRSNNELKRQLLRNTLKNIEAFHTDSPHLMRCHRSYMVNPSQVNQIVSSPGKTDLDLGLVTIPVSKKYRAAFQLDPAS